MRMKGHKDSNQPRHRAGRRWNSHELETQARDIRTFHAVAACGGWRDRKHNNGDKNNDRENNNNGDKNNDRKNK